MTPSLPFHRRHVVAGLLAAVALVPALVHLSGSPPAAVVVGPARVGTGAAGLSPEAPAPSPSDDGHDHHDHDDDELLAEQRAAGLQCTSSSRGLPVCVHGEDRRPPAPADPLGPVAVEGPQTSSGTPSGGRIGCYGDGTSGPRVRAVFARAEGTKSRYAAVLPSIRSWAAGLDTQFDLSAQRTGGRRHVRFATTAGPDCSLVVLDVALPSAAFRSFAATVDALELKGLHRASSKYLVWADTTGYCGIATTYADDRPSLDNLNNSHRPSYARVDRACWGAAEAHELVHMLGGVQRSAKSSTGGFHCNDGLDVMCYDDRSARSTQRSVCPQDRHQRLDCRNDDYFSTAAPKGSYLQTHWNTARSSSLSASLSDPAPAPGPSSSAPAVTASGPSPQPAPTASPSPTSAPPRPPSPSPSPSDRGLLGLLPVLPTLAPLPSTTLPLARPAGTRS